MLNISHYEPILSVGNVLSLPRLWLIPYLILEEQIVCTAGFCKSFDLTLHFLLSD